MSEMVAGAVGAEGHREMDIRFQLKLRELLLTMR
jgi:hypothetical protein